MLEDRWTGRAGVGPILRRPSETQRPLPAAQLLSEGETDGIPSTYLSFPSFGSDALYALAPGESITFCSFYIATCRGPR